MKRLKKFAAVLLSVVMLVCCFGVTASAKSIYDDAVYIKATEIVSHKFKNDTEILYRISLSDSGYITFYCSDYSHVYYGEAPNLTLLDSNGNTIISSDMLDFRVNRQYEIPKKGTYYIRITKKGEDSYFNRFYYGFKPSEEPSVSLALNAKVGDEFDFSALATNYKGKCTWKSTETKVATVSAGKG